MSRELQDYAAGVADWRKALHANTRRTYAVIASFILIYLAIGMLVDMYLASGTYRTATLPQLFGALITFHIFPKATLVLAIVAICSLLVTFWMGNRLMLLGTEYHEITASNTRNLSEQQLYNVIEEMKVAAGLHYMPKVYVIEADYMNAFASGYSEKSAMVAITRGLLDKLDRSELQAVMAHELSHIRHMDIKLTLMASVLSNITLMVLDMLFYTAIFGGDRRDDGKSRNQLFVIIMFLRYLLPVITVLLMLYLSRTREYMADAGSVELLRDNEPLARALLKIQQDHEANKDTYANQYLATPHENIRREAYIFDPIQAGFEPATSIADLFSTHPDITRRLAALGFKKKAA
ncbi:MAG: zinc metalloprotease HtpX [Gammaproteobacteria bacterium]